MKYPTEGVKSKVNKLNDFGIKIKILKGQGVKSNF